MTIREYIQLRNITEMYKTEEEIVKALLSENKHLKLKEAKEVITSYYEDIVDEKDVLIQKFKIDGVEYGLIPSFEDISTAEFLDISNYENDPMSIHRLMAILYRPIKKSAYNYYSIEDYEGSYKYRDVMLDVDYKIYKSAVGFFLTLSEICLKDLHTSTMEKIQKEKVK